MTSPLLCGTDFSPLAHETAEVAAQLALALGAPLHLLHATLATHDAAPRLAEAAASLPGPIVPEMVLGTADLALQERAKTLQPLLVAVGSLGRRSLTDWLLGSTAEQVVHANASPTLVVRQPHRLKAWLQGERPLRVMIAVRHDSPVEPLRAWLERLAAAGPTTVLAVEVSGGADLGDSWFEAETDRLAQHTGLPRSDCRIEVQQWEIHEHILRCADREAIDLLVMGAQLHPDAEPVVRARVPLAVVRRATIAVALIPHHQSAGTGQGSQHP